MTTVTQQALLDAVNVLELGPLFAEAGNCGTLEAAQAFCQRLREQVKINHRRLAFDAHPDRGGDLAAMQELNAARDLLLKLDVRPRRPRPVRIVVFVSEPFNSWCPGTSVTGTGTGGGWY